jgi:autotransporter-associated beta strand protein
MLLLADQANSQQPSILITGYMANPTATDSNFEYVQLIATRDINFSTSNHSLVVTNNGSATSDGWVAGGSLTFGFNLTTGTVRRGESFYVGGSGKRINGSGSTDLSSLNFIRSIDNTSTGGDGFGAINGSGILGNGGADADGIAVFSGLTNSLTSSSIPLDSLFFGSGTGNAVVSGGSAGYQLASNDRYSGGKLQATSFLFADPAAGQFTRLSGAYQFTDNTFSTSRTASTVNSPTAIEDIASTYLVNHDMTWNSTNGTWNQSFASTNWTTTGSVASNFVNGDRAIFNGNSGGTITIDAGGVSPNLVHVSANSGTYTFSGGAITGSGSLTKSNAGTLVVQNTNSYSGSTTISGGTLRLSGSGSINSSSAISVGASGTLLQTSSVRIVPTVTASGPLSGVDGTAGGSQQFTQVIMNNGSRIAVEISGTISSISTDQLDVSGTLDLLPSRGKITIDLTGVGFTTTDYLNSQEFQIASAGTLKINGSTISSMTTVTSSFVVTSSSFTVFSYRVRANATGLFVTFATPEPATVLLICAGTAGVVYLLRRSNLETNGN